MSHSSLSRRRRAAARKNQSPHASSANRRVAPAEQYDGGANRVAPPRPNGSEPSPRPPTARWGAFDEADGRRQPMPPLPSVQTSAQDAPIGSGHRAGMLTPVLPVAQPMDEEFEPESGEYEVEPDTADAPFAIYRPQPTSERRGLFQRRSAFSLRERDWRTLAWLHRMRAIPAAGALVAIFLIVGAFALVLASRAASSAGSHLLGSTSTDHSSTRAVVVQAPQTLPPTTIATSQYQVGVWVSNYAPGTQDSIQIYVRVSENPTPVAHVPVTLVLQLGQTSSTFGPITTDSDGLAIFNASYSGATSGQPIYAIATASIGAQTVSGQTTFVAGGGADSNNMIVQPPGGR